MMRTMTRDRDAYTARINRVIDHIERNLDRRLSLDELSRVASFSPYHFHRVFSAMVGETLSSFVGRLRLERAASQLLYAPQRAVTEVALDSGFSSPASFARAFKAHFGVSASEWRKIGKTDRNEEKALRKLCGAFAVSDGHLDPTTNSWRWRITMKHDTTDDGAGTLEAEVTVRRLEPLHVAYLRHVGPNKGDAELFGRLWGAHDDVGRAAGAVRSRHHAVPVGVPRRPRDHRRGAAARQHLHHRPPRHRGGR